MKKAFKLALLTLAAACLLGACAAGDVVPTEAPLGGGNAARMPAEDDAGAAAGAAPNAPAAEPGSSLLRADARVYVNEDLRFSIEFPSNWNEENYKIVVSHNSVAAEAAASAVSTTDYTYTTTDILFKGSKGAPLYSIWAEPVAVWRQKYLSEAPVSRMLGQRGDTVFSLVVPVENPVNGDDAALYQAMSDSWSDSGVTLQGGDEPFTVTGTVRAVEERRGRQPSVLLLRADDGRNLNFPLSNSGREFGAEAETPQLQKDLLARRNKLVLECVGSIDGGNTDKTTVLSIKEVPR